MPLKRAKMTHLLLILTSMVNPSIMSSFSLIVARGFAETISCVVIREDISRKIVSPWVLLVNTAFTVKSAVIYTCGCSWR
ncbi:hypothetical protein V8C40DRAFT_250500 [Trichoderma camerunense]